MPVELVFIHGWGFDARFWDALSVQLTQFRQMRVDLGFFGAPAVMKNSDTLKPILIGHSLGFIHGLQKRRDWGGWIAINGFPRFVTGPSGTGCVNAAVLSDMRQRLQIDPSKTLEGFYQLIRAQPLGGAPDTERLHAGLDELRDSDTGNLLARLDIPGLALASRNDPLVSLTVSEELGQYARQGGVKLHDDAGHLLPQADPAWCAAAIAHFVTSNLDQT